MKMKNEEITWAFVGWAPPWNSIVPYASVACGRVCLFGNQRSPGEPGSIPWMVGCVWRACPQQHLHNFDWKKHLEKKKCVREREIFKVKIGENEEKWRETWHRMCTGFKWWKMWIYRIMQNKCTRISCRYFIKFSQLVKMQLKMWAYAQSMCCFLVNILLFSFQAEIDKKPFQFSAWFS